MTDKNLERRCTFSEYLKYNTVMILENDETIANLIQKLLSKKGIRSYIVTTGRQAEQEFMRYKNRTNLAIVDIGLPDVDGTKVIEILRETKPSLESIIFTGWWNEDLLLKATNLQIKAFLRKPDDITRLACVVLKSMEELYLDYEKDVESKILEEDKKKLKDSLNARCYLTAKGILGSVTHNLRQPLSVIGGFAQRQQKSVDELMKKLQKTIPAEEYVYYENWCKQWKKSNSLIVENVKRLERHLSSMVEYGRKFPLMVGVTYLDNTIEELLEDVRPELEKKKLTLFYSNEEIIEPFVMNVDYFKQLLRSMTFFMIEHASNGDELSLCTSLYSPSSTERMISCLGASDYLEISVVNQATPIEEYHKEFLLSPLYEHKSMDEHDSELINSRHIVESLEGRIILDNNDGEGAYLKVWVPYKKA